MPPKRKNLAIDSDEDVDSDQPLADTFSRSNKAKGKQRRRDLAIDDEDSVSGLIENTQAGLKIQSNGKGRDKEKKRDKEKGKSKEQERDVKKGKGKEKEKSDQSNGKKKAKEPVSSEVDSAEEEEELDGTASEGTLYDSDDEPDLGKWTKTDQETWQEPPAVSPTGEYVVDIIISWRWHPKYHYPQYRVKWQDYMDVHNEWEPFENFQGEQVEDFWSDCEFAGIEHRPPGWDNIWNDEVDEDTGEILRTGLKTKLQKQGIDTENPEDTDSQLNSKDPRVRKEARKKKRTQIRRDRVDMRQAYKRRQLRKSAKEKEEKERKEKEAEMRRRKKREIEEEAKMKEAGPSKKTVDHGLKIRPIASTKAPAASSTSKMTSIPASTATPASSTSRDVSAASKKTTGGNDQLALARLFLTEPDAKKKVERTKARMEEEKSRARDVGADADEDVAIPAAISATATTREVASEANRDATTSSPRAGSTSAVRGAIKTAGSFRGAHKNRRLTQAFDPLAMVPAKAANGGRPDLTMQRPVNSNASTAQSPLFPPTSGWDDDTSINPGIATSAPTRQAPPISANGTGQFARQSALKAPLPHPRGPMRMGNDPRARPTAMPMSAPANGIPPSPMSPFGPLSNTSPLHPNASPYRPNQQSPREGTSGGMSPLLGDQRGSDSMAAFQERARKAIEDGRWHLDENLKKRISSSYNLLCPRPQEGDRDTRYLLDGVIGLLKGGVIKTIEAKHKERNRSVNAWVYNARVRLSPPELEALSIPTVRFYEYEGSIQEIWPANKGKIVMYTLGALMLKIVEQVFDKKKTDAWTVEEGTSIMVHPWQKTVLNQLIETDVVDDFLKVVAGISEDVPDKGFEVIESGMKVLEELEEVPSEFCAPGGDVFDVEDMKTELRRVTLAVDKEVSSTLHRLQYEWRHDKRMFTLIMAKTRLDPREIPTAFDSL